MHHRCVYKVARSWYIPVEKFGSSVKELERGLLSAQFKRSKHFQVSYGVTIQSGQISLTREVPS